VKEYFTRRNEANKFDKFWRDSGTRSVYFIGKDNIPFHTIIFPALLMSSGEGYVLPFNVASTEFLLYEGEKFSKSERRGIWMDEALKLLPPDYWRFYMIYTRPEQRDSNFSWEDFESKVNDELNDIVGNLAHRVLSFIDSRYGGTVPLTRLDEESNSLLEEVKSVGKIIEDNLIKIRLRDALKGLIEIARLGNKFFNSREPWRDFEVNRERANSTILVSYQLLKILAYYMHIFLPFSAEKLWNMLGLDGEPDMRAAFSTDAIGRVRSVEPLFRKIRKEELIEKLRQIRERGEVLSAREL
ncbi:MAG: class I tRNA ligase family protein, partial [Candidatus Korarchaeum sp.]